MEALFLSVARSDSEISVQMANFWEPIIIMCPKKPTSSQFCNFIFPRAETADPAQQQINFGSRPSFDVLGFLECQQWDMDGFKNHGPFCLIYFVVSRVPFDFWFQLVWLILECSYFERQNRVVFCWFHTYGDDPFNWWSRNPRCYPDWWKGNAKFRLAGTKSPEWQK